MTLPSNQFFKIHFPWTSPAHNNSLASGGGLVLVENFVTLIRFVGQDAASERHHCRNTNVGSKRSKKIRLLALEDLKLIFRHITFLFLLTILLDSCNDKQKLDRNDVEYIEIQKQADTVSFLLTSAQIDDFIDNLNKSSVKGLTKYLPEYTLKVYIKGDSAISFRTSNNLIKQSDDKTYVIERTDYFRTLWLRQAGLSDN
ncbi:MAG: hypothetical protein ACK5TU_02540, partial [Cyclobacteriaceae bacterium]